MKTVVNSEYQYLREEIARLPRLMGEGQGEVVSDGRNRVVRLSIPLPQEEAAKRHQPRLLVVVKRFKRPNILQQLVYTFFRKTKAERAYLYAHEYLRRGIDTPKPVAYMEERHCGLFTTGYFVSLEVPCTEVARLLGKMEGCPAGLVEAVARQVVKMHSCGVLHGDLNLSNFLLTRHPSFPEAMHFTMADINRTHFVEGMPTDKQCLRNLVRLTHCRDLYAELVGSYATQRGWDADTTVSKAMALLSRFEKMKELRKP